MAQRRRIIWTERAQDERKDILKFWITHNKSTSYSRKLERLFREKLKLLSTNPYIGRKTDLGDDIRIKRILHYHVFYKINARIIVVLAIWDTRRDPDDFKL